jgi:hypothetical protein
MKLFLLCLILMSVQVLAQPKTETFVVQIADRSMTVLSPDKKRDTFSVLIENKSLSDQIGKIIVQGKILKFVSIKSGLSEAVEIENKSSANVFFVPVSPAFQEVELIFGKKVYEIPSKK